MIYYERIAFENWNYRWSNGKVKTIQNFKKNNKHSDDEFKKTIGKAIK